MAEIKEYQVRPRGEYMMSGITIYAENYEKAAQKLYKINKKINNKKIDCIVIDTTTGNWTLVFLNNYPRGQMFNEQSQMIKIDGQIIHPFEYSSEKRLAIAKHCEASSQDHEETARLFKLKNAPSKPSLEFTNFDDQLKKYKEAQKNNILHETHRQENHQQCKEHAVTQISEFQKECLLVESAIITIESEKAKTAILAAKEHLKNAKMFAENSHAPGDTKINSTDKMVANAEKELDKIDKKHTEFRKELWKEVRQGKGWLIPGGTKKQQNDLNFDRGI